jgi:hypothetical protein
MAIYRELRQESLFSKEWWAKYIHENAEVFEGYMDPKTATKHQAKIKKLKKFLDSNFGRPFVYDFADFDKTIFSVPLTEAIQMIKEGGAAGHMAHPYDDYSLSFGDVKEIIARALGGYRYYQSQIGGGGLPSIFAGAFQGPIIIEGRRESGALASGQLQDIRIANATTFNTASALIGGKVIIGGSNNWLI